MRQFRDGQKVKVIHLGDESMITSGNFSVKYICVSYETNKEIWFNVYYDNGKIQKFNGRFVEAVDL